MSVKAKDPRGGARWQSVDQEQGNRELFMRYAGGNPSSQLHHENVQSGSIQSRRRYVTEVSHISQGDGFKKARINQLDTLRQLRQEYEILRGLPIQDEFLKHSHRQRQQSEASLQSISSQFKLNKKNNERSARDTQMLILQKRQLELVIGNSMRKVEELLNNEMQYKKIIHQLQLQLDSKIAQDKAESLTKTMKRNESQFNERIENLKKEIGRLKQSNHIWEEKYDTLNAELQKRIAQVRKFKQEKRSIQEQVRFQKDKLLSLEIDIKRVRMQSEVLAKDRNTQIARLTGLLELQPQNSFGTTQIHRLEGQLKIAKQKYDSLFNEFERFKRNSNEKQKQIKNQKKSESDQIKLFQNLINHMREDSAHQKRASMDLIASMIAKIEGKQVSNQENSRVLDELSNLRNDLSTIKRDREGIQNPLIGLVQSAADFNAKIRILQQQIADGSVTKQNLLKEYETIRSSYEFTKSEYQKLNTENQRLKKLLQNSHQQVNEQGDRILRRQLEEAQFEIQKARKQGQFNLGMARAETESRLQILEGQLKRSEMNNSNLRQEIDKMREYYESKIAEKNALLDKTSTQFSVFKSTREQSLQQIRSQSELKMNQMTKRIADLAELSQRSLNQNMRVSILEQELSRLRSSAMRSKAMSDNVDHLWQIKQTEYANIHQLISETKIYP